LFVNGAGGVGKTEGWVRGVGGGITRGGWRFHWIDSYKGKASMVKLTCGLRGMGFAGVPSTKEGHRASGRLKSESIKWK